MVIFIWIAYGHTQQVELDVNNNFSNDYSESRQKFIKASYKSGAQVRSIEHPLKGPKGEALFTDIALIGPDDANTILVLISGTHGVEGFAGSAIQTGLLNVRAFADLEPDISIVLIHALNPYGFSYLRRFNEKNVDLNRNFTDHTKPYPANPGYVKLAEAISPNSISFWVNVKSTFMILHYRLMKGKIDLKRAISGGQYTDPQGLFYGGNRESWSYKTIRYIANNYLSKAKRVVVIDFHTGLGAYGNAEVILNVNVNSLAYKRAVEWWGERVTTTIKPSIETISVHLPASLKLAIPRMPPETEVTAVSLEFGTYSTLKVFRALREENWLHNYGTEDNPERNKIKTNLLRAFYPDDDSWRYKVWKQGKEVVEQAIYHLR
jgi:hypothetical protein